MPEKEKRKFTIYSLSRWTSSWPPKDREVPQLKIQGKWLQKLGFEAGDYVEVVCEEEKLIIKKIKP